MHEFRLLHLRAKIKFKHYVLSTFVTSFYNLLIKDFSNPFGLKQILIYYILIVIFIMNNTMTFSMKFYSIL